MHATKTVPCKSALRKLLQRAIHTFPVCSSAQAFRTRDTHFPLFVCRRRLRGIHTFAFRHRLLERGVHTFRTSSVSSSAQLAFRTGHKPLFVRWRRPRATVFVLMNNSSFTNWTTTHTHINRHINWQQHAIVESTRVVKAFDESYGSMDSWGQLCDGVI